MAPVPSPSFTASRAPPCPCLHPREGPAAACKSSHGAAARASPGGGRCSRASRRFPLPLKSLLGASSPGERGGLSTQACGGNITNGLHRIKGQCGLLELRPMHWKVTSSVPSQGMCPDCRFGPQLGCAGRGTPLNGLFSSQFPPWGHSAAPEQEEERVTWPALRPVGETDQEAGRQGRLPRLPSPQASIRMATGVLESPRGGLSRLCLEPQGARLVGVLLALRCVKAAVMGRCRSVHHPLAGPQHRSLRLADVYPGIPSGVLRARPRWAPCFTGGAGLWPVFSVVPMATGH